MIALTLFPKDKFQKNLLHIPWNLILKFIDYLITNSLFASVPPVSKNHDNTGRAVTLS